MKVEKQSMGDAYVGSRGLGRGRVTLETLYYAYNLLFLTRYIQVGCSKQPMGSQSFLGNKYYHFW